MKFLVVDRNRSPSRRTDMSSRSITAAAAALLLALVITGPAGAATVWNDVTTDLSNDRSAPTLVPFGPGANDIIGTTGSTDGTAATGDRDYFRFVIPTGLVLKSLIVIDTQLTAGGKAFIGLES